MYRCLFSDSWFALFKYNGADAVFRKRNAFRFFSAVCLFQLYRCVCRIHRHIFSGNRKSDLFFVTLVDENKHGFFVGR